MASMGTVYPYRHLIRSARTGVAFVPRRTITYTPIRHAQNDNNDPNKAPEPESKPSAFNSIKKFFFGRQGDEKPKAEKQKITRTSAAPPKTEGSLSADSIFAEDGAGPKLKSTGRTPKSAGQVDDAEASSVDYSVEGRDPAKMQQALMPRPKAMRTWQRKMVIKEVRKRGRLPKAVKIARTEREALCKSHWFKTSLKKLGPLARQIAGKNIDDAITQMRFSKKKAAKDVLEHLEHAKNVAIARNGMGLKETGDSEAKQNPTTVVLKSGEKLTITDPSAIYIAQAWVNRGPYGLDQDHRARGQIYMLRPPHTALSLLLKEERTRIREWQDREAKALRQRRSQLWTHLPDRKIYGQNQYYSW